MPGTGAVWRRITTLCPSRQKATAPDTDTCDEESTSSEFDSAASGSEWLYIEEPVGFFMPKMQKRIQHLHLDQAQHLLHYGNFKHVMRLHNISLVTPIEEMDAHGVSRWWMTIQDPSMLQVWVVHFPSRHRMQAWIDLLTSVFNATNTCAVVSELVYVGTQQSPPS